MGQILCVKTGTGCNFSQIQSHVMLLYSSSTYFRSQLLENTNKLVLQQKIYCDRHTCAKRVILHLAIKHGALTRNYERKVEFVLNFPGVESFSGNNQKINLYSKNTENKFRFLRNSTEHHRLLHEQANPLLDKICLLVLPTTRVKTKI